MISRKLRELSRSHGHILHLGGGGERGDMGAYICPKSLCYENLKWKNLILCKL
jgi:hypothetical protein